MASLKNTPEFEQMTAAETTTTKETSMNTTTAAKTDAGVQASTAIATASANAVTTPSAKFTLAFVDKNCVFDTDTVKGLSLATPRIKGEQGSLFKGDEDLGDAIQFELISFNHRWAIGSGEDDAEAKDFFKTSYDGKTLSDSGASMADYVDSLKAQGFSKAKASQYMDLFGFVTWTAKKGSIAVEDRELCLLQCSPTSVGAWTAFCTTQGLLQSKGVAKPFDVIEVHAEKRTKGTNKYTNFSFSVPKQVK